MRRWNGWGDDSMNKELPAEALVWLERLLGKGHQSKDVALESYLKGVKSSRLPKHALISTDSRARMQVALGESYRDWICKKVGELPAVPDGVAFPESSVEVRKLLDLAHERNWVVIPYAGGTSVVGHLDCPLGNRPVLSLNLSKMNKLLHIDPVSQLARFQAGTPGPQIEAQLREHGFMLGHFPQSYEYSTLGGWVVTRSSGQQSLRYGRIEQMFAGGRMETPTGTLDIPTIPATGAGLDIRELVLGSEGRFGVLTEVDVRVSRLPEHESFHAVFFPNWEKGEAAIRETVQTRIPLSMMRMNNAGETEIYLNLAGHNQLVRLLKRYLEWRDCGDEKCWLTFGITEQSKVAGKRVLADVRQIMARHGGVYVGTKLGSKWLEGRYHGPYLRNVLWDNGFSVDTIETAVDWPRVKPLMDAMEKAAHHAFAQFGVKVRAGTHLSHVYSQGSSVYSTFIWPTAAGGFEPNLELWLSYKSAVSRAILAHGGTISHQHGVGRDHAAFLVGEKKPMGIDTIATLCKHFDPKRIMNPGKLIPESEKWTHRTTTL